MTKMDDKTLASVIQNRMGDCIGVAGDQLSQQRIDALKYYRGDLFGNEKDGRSQVVLRMVAEAVDGMLPGLMKVFTSGDEVIRFEPRGPEDEQGAKQATDYVNWIVMQQNDGYRIFNVWFKDALLQKTGVVKVWWDESEHITKEVYRGLSEQQYQMLMMDPDIEITEEEISSGVMMDTTVMTPLPIQPTYDVTISRTNKTGRVCIEPVPPEEFVIEKGATSLEDSLFCGHRFRRTVSWWIGQGYDPEKVKKAAGIGTLDITGERSIRFSDEDITETESTADESTAYVWGAECYGLIDYDGDGRAEMRKVTVVGDSQFEVLDNVEIDEYPFASITPILMPHKFTGMSVADQTMDLQLWGSTLVRQMNDNLYLTNDPQRIVVEGKVNLDDLLSGGPGRAVRATDVNAVREVTVPFWAKETFPMLEYIDGLSERRTGNTRYNQGLDADSLNKTATGINIIQTAAQQRQELIARTFAETGVKRLFKLVLGCVTKYQNKPEIIRLRNEWVAMDPREWKTSYDTTVNVGLGTGNKQEQIATITNLLGMDMKIIELAGGFNPMLTQKNVYNKLVKLIEASGLKSPEAYYTDPDTAPPQQPKPSPEEQKMQMEMQKMQAQMQLDQQKAEGELVRKQREAEIDAQIEIMKANLQMELEKAKAAMQMEIERMKAGVQAEIARDKASHEAKLQTFRAAHDASQADDNFEREQARADQAAEREAQRAETE